MGCGWEDMNLGLSNVSVLLGVKTLDSGVIDTWVRGPFLLLTSYATLGRFLHLPTPQFYLLQYRENSTYVRHRIVEKI